MRHPIVTGLNVAALIFMVIVWVASPSFVKQNAFLFWGVFILTAIRLASTLMASSQEEEFDQKVLTTQQKAEQAIATAGQPAATVWVYRIPSFIGKLSSVEVFCDGEPLASLPNGAYVVRKVAPGPHALTSVVSSTPIPLSVEAGQEYFIRTGFTGLVRRAWEVVSKQQAQSEMSRLKEVN